MLLNLGDVFYFATGRLKNGLKVCIDDEWRYCKILVLVELDLRLLTDWHREHMEHRDKDISIAKLFVSL